MAEATTAWRRNGATFSVVHHFVKSRPDFWPKKPSLFNAAQFHDLTEWLISLNVGTVFGDVAGRLCLDAAVLFSVEWIHQTGYDLAKDLLAAIQNVGRAIVVEQDETAVHVPPGPEERPVARSPG